MSVDRDSAADREQSERAVPKVRIRYCGPCGYRGRAEALARKIRERMGREVVLERGNFGVFKVWLGDVKVFDKRSTGGWLGKLGFGQIPPDDVILDDLRMVSD